MLPLKNRLVLRQQPDFFKHSSQKQGAFFKVNYQSGKNEAKFAIIVPKFRVKNVVERNKIKRKLRGIVVQLIEEGQLKGFWAVRVNNRISQRLSSTLSDDLRKLVGSF